MLDVVDLTVAYGGVTAVNSVSLTVAEGSITTVLGANGAGKTTLVRAISGLVKARRNLGNTSGKYADSCGCNQISNGTLTP